MSLDMRFGRNTFYFCKGSVVSSIISNSVPIFLYLYELCVIQYHFTLKYVGSYCCQALSIYYYIIYIGIYCQECAFKMKYYFLIFYNISDVLT